MVTDDGLVHEATRFQTLLLLKLYDTLYRVRDFLFSGDVGTVSTEEDMD